jgi:hypothetical protein
MPPCMHSQRNAVALTDTLTLTLSLSPFLTLTHASLVMLRHCRHACTLSDAVSEHYERGVKESVRVGVKVGVEVRE